MPTPKPRERVTPATRESGVEIANGQEGSDELNSLLSVKIEEEIELSGTTFL
jgi:predicted peroxiredoxin